MDASKLLAATATAFAVALTAVTQASAEPAAVEPDSPSLLQTQEVFSPDGSISEQDVTVRPAEAEPLDVPTAVATVTPIQVTGDSADRLDLVFVGDGYTEADLPTYSEHVQSKIDDLFEIEPYKSYRDLFNIWQVDVVSPESGVDNDPPGSRRNTAFDAYYSCGNIARLLCLDSAKATAAAQQAPEADQILAVVNSDVYGGSGGRVATVSGGNARASQIAAHELGHSIGGLADEYTGGGPSCKGSELRKPNASVLNREQQIAQQTKWWRWMDQPTPDGGTISAFEGAAYCDAGTYRPSENSLMRTLGREFNAPSREAMIARFYDKASVATASRIDTPTSDVDAPDATSFEVTPSGPGPHEITWSVDGQRTLSADGELAFTLPESSRTGEQTVEVTVVDTSEWVRDPALREQLTWSRSWSTGP